VESRVEGGKLESGVRLQTEDDLDKGMQDAKEETELEKGLKGFEEDAEGLNFMESQEVGSGVAFLTGKCAEWGVNLQSDHPPLGSSNPAAEVPKGGAVGGDLKAAVAEAADLQQRGEKNGEGLAVETQAMQREGEKDEKGEGEKEQKKEKGEDGKGTVAGEEVADIASQIRECA
jgi:hypothetical protein